MRNSIQVLMCCVLSLVLAQGASIAQFVDATPAPLLDSALANGVAWGDFDNDGDADLALANYSGSSNKIFRNDGNGVFVDITSGAMATSNAHGVAWADYDNDGDLDLYFAYPGVDSLFRNDGSEVFTLVTGGALGDSSESVSATWGDMENDGDVDLYLSSVGPNKMLRNDGGDVFTDATTGPLGDSSNPSIGVWGDYDNDGDLDIYLVNHASANKLLRNDGSGNFVDVTGPPLDDSGYGTAAAWGDYDNDGDLDIYSANTLGEPNRLLRNDGAGVFTDVTTTLLAGADHTQGVAWGDYDNDADLDLALTVNGANLLLRNDGGFFADATAGPIGDSRNSTGGAWADYDLDGDLDFMVATWGGTKMLLRNDTATGNHWLHVKLIGTVSNAAAIGARVTIISGGAMQIREVSGGSGYYSQDSFPVEFGLGSENVVSTLQVRWPSGIVQDFSSIAADQVIVITEAEQTVTDIAIDIKPGGPQNTINLSSAGSVPVAMLSSSEFDALTIDPDTLSLAGARVKMIGRSNRVLCHEQDANHDDLLDLVCNFETAQFMLEVGDSLAVLEGATYDSDLIRGEDLVRIVPD